MRGSPRRLRVPGTAGAVGDVLLLRHPPDAPLEVTTNDVTFAYAIASNHRRRLAAAIVPTPYAAAKDSA